MEKPRLVKAGASRKNVVRPADQVIAKGSGSRFHAMMRRISERLDRINAGAAERAIERDRLHGTEPVLIYRASLGHKASHRVNVEVAAIGSAWIFVAAERARARVALALRVWNVLELGKARRSAIQQAANALRSKWTGR